MIGVVVAAHGKLATSLVETAQQVVTGAIEVVSVSLESNDDPGNFQEKLKAAVVQLGKGDGVLVLTDMFGGTPSNVGMTLHAVGKVEVLTGANLPMLIKALTICQKEPDVSKAAQLVKEAGQSAIAIASEVLAGTPQSKEAVR